MKHHKYNTDIELSETNISTMLDEISVKLNVYNTKFFESKVRYYYGQLTVDENGRITMVQLEELLSSREVSFTGIRYVGREKLVKSEIKFKP